MSCARSLVQPQVGRIKRTTGLNGLILQLSMLLYFPQTLLKIRFIVNSSVRRIGWFLNHDTLFNVT